jgi:hypothetical protein
MKQLPGAVPAHIQQRVLTLRALDQALQDCLPAECHAHCRAAGLSDGTLYLVTDSPAWHTRLRFHSDRIISHVSQLGKSHVRRLELRVSRSLEPPAPRVHAGPARQIPAGSARAFAALAEETSDADLRAVLERLARRGERS